MSLSGRLVILLLWRKNNNNKQAWINTYVLHREQHTHTPTHTHTHIAHPLRLRTVSLAIVLPLISSEGNSLSILLLRFNLERLGRTTFSCRGGMVWIILVERLTSTRVETIVSTGNLEKRLQLRLSMVSFLNACMCVCVCVCMSECMCMCRCVCA